MPERSERFRVKRESVNEVEGCSGEGKLQYYRAEMEPYVPDEIKWQIRVPTRFVMRELKVTYLS